MNKLVMVLLIAISMVVGIVVYLKSVDLVVATLAGLATGMFLAIFFVHDHLPEGDDTPRM